MFKHVVDVLLTNDRASRRHIAIKELGGAVEHITKEDGVQALGRRNVDLETPNIPVVELKRTGGVCCRNA